jgi:hypothetical protein
MMMMMMMMMMMVTIMLGKKIYGVPSVYHRRAATEPSRRYNGYLQTNMLTISALYDDDAFEFSI